MTGPLAAAAHTSFTAHTWSHLLGGMLAPTLLVLAAPVTLALRSMAVTPARRLSRLLRSPAARVIAHPIPAAILSASGLWMIYLTPVLAAAGGNSFGHAVIHAHLLATGYLFTAAVIGLDPRPHRAPRALIATVMVLTFAAHSALAKYLYAHPPTGYEVADVRAGAEFMYYAGAVVESVAIVIFCARWYRAAGRVAGSADHVPIGVSRPA